MNNNKLAWCLGAFGFALISIVIVASFLNQHEELNESTTTEVSLEEEIEFEPQDEYQTFKLRLHPNSPTAKKYPSNFSFEYPISFRKQSMRQLCDNNRTCINIGLDFPYNPEELSIEDLYSKIHGGKTESIRVDGVDAFKYIGTEVSPAFETAPPQQIYSARLYIPFRKEILEVSIIYYGGDSSEEERKRIRSTIDHIIETIQIEE